MPDAQTLRELATHAYQKHLAAIRAATDRELEGAANRARCTICGLPYGFTRHRGCWEAEQKQRAASNAKWRAFMAGIKAKETHND